MKTTSLTRLTAALAVTCAVALPSLAQDTDHTAMDHDMSAELSPAVGDAPSTAAYKSAANLMHQDMAIEYTDNADVDFMRGMIPHHQAAVAMAKIALAHGTDPEVRKLAEEVIAAQTAEIEMMQEWLKVNAPE